MTTQPDFTVKRIGPPRFDSPLHLSHIEGDYIADFVPDGERILFDNSLSTLKRSIEEGTEILSFEAAGPRDRIFFNPETVTAAIVTCGGLCPGLNDVIRGLVLQLQYNYRVKKIWGIRYGYMGMTRDSEWEPIELTPSMVDDIASLGGTFLGSSRGPQPVNEMVDFLEARGINMLFTIGGDGTQRGALAIVDEIEKRGHAISVIGIPKTIDNDISYVEKSFGFDTAFSIASTVLSSAHAEAKGVLNGIAIVKLMGRQSGFLACHASIANGNVNFTLIPEAPFDLDPPNGFLAALEKRIVERHHAVVVVGEGTGQEFFTKNDGEIERDASGNVILDDIGIFLRNRVEAHFRKRNIPFTVKYFDPSYLVRSLEAAPSDRMFCLRLAQNAVHAAFTGRTGMLVGYWNSSFTHVPIAAAISKRKVVNLEKDLWLTVVETNGQPKTMLNEIGSR